MASPEGRVPYHPCASALAIGGCSLMGVYGKASGSQEGTVSGASLSLCSLPRLLAVGIVNVAF